MPEIPSGERVNTREDDQGATVPYFRVGNGISLPYFSYYTRPMDDKRAKNVETAWHDVLESIRVNEGYLSHRT